MAAIRTGRRGKSPPLRTDYQGSLTWDGDWLERHMARDRGPRPTDAPRSAGELHPRHSQTSVKSIDRSVFSLQPRSRPPATAIACIRHCAKAVFPSDGEGPYLERPRTMHCTYLTNEPR